MERVIAIESFKKGVLRTYGEGHLVLNQIPDQEPFGSVGIENPCIKLDTGKYVWGFQCWWSPIDRFEKKYRESITETIQVDIGKDEVKPLIEPSESQG